VSEVMVIRVRPGLASRGSRNTAVRVRGSAGMTREGPKVVVVLSSVVSRGVASEGWVMSVVTLWGLGLVRTRSVTEWCWAVWRRWERARVTAAAGMRV